MAQGRRRSAKGQKTMADARSSLAKSFRFTSIVPRLTWCNDRIIKCQASSPGPERRGGEPPMARADDGLDAGRARAERPSSLERQKDQRCIHTTLPRLHHRSFDGEGVRHLDRRREGRLGKAVLRLSPPPPDQVQNPGGADKQSCRHLPGRISSSGLFRSSGPLRVPSREFGSGDVE
jgi:hypothetical protein